MPVPGQADPAIRWRGRQGGRQIRSRAGVTDEHGQPGWPGKRRPRKHGRELSLSDPSACPGPQVTTSTVTTRYGTARAAAC